MPYHTVLKCSYYCAYTGKKNSLANSSEYYFHENATKQAVRPAVRPTHYATPPASGDSNSHPYSFQLGSHNTLIVYRTLMSLSNPRAVRLPQPPASAWFIDL